MSKNKNFSEVGAERFYLDELAKGEFKIQFCGDCSQHFFYPRIVCPHCGSTSVAWVKPSGRGVVYSTSVPRAMPEGTYNISLVDLEEGPRMMTRVTDIEPENVSIGMKVVAHIGEIDSVPVVLFKPAEAKA